MGAKKKKKGNQNKAVEDVANTNSVEVAPLEQNNGSVVEENQSIHSYNNVDVQSFGALELDLDQEKQKADEATSIKLQEAVEQLEDERHSWLQKQATFEDKIDVLQKEVSLFVQKESALEQSFKELQMANDSLTQKQVILEDKIKNVDDIKDSLILKESFLKETVARLEETNISLQAQSALEQHFKELQMTNDSLIQKQVILEDKIKNVDDDIKDSLILKECFLKEMIARVEETNISLQAQVKQLEWSRNNIVEENRRLMESITLLQAKVESLEKDVSSHGKLTETIKPSEGQTTIEQIGVDPVVEKRIHEKLEFARKVSETYPEEGHHDSVADPTSSIEVNQDRMSNVYLSPRNRALEYHDGRLETAERAHSAVGIMNDKNDINDFVSENTVLSRPSPGLDNSKMSDEIVTLPLDEIQIDEDDLRETQNDDDPETLPLSDAPLIGAPFRLISFVAKYVSGADLVNQKSSGSHR